MSKIEVKNVYKIFGEEPTSVLPIVQGGASKEEVLEKTDHTIVKYVIQTIILKDLVNEINLIRWHHSYKCKSHLNVEDGVQPNSSALS